MILSELIVILIGLHMQDGSKHTCLKATLTHIFSNNLVSLLYSSASFKILSDEVLKSHICLSGLLQL